MAKDRGLHRKKKLNPYRIGQQVQKVEENRGWTRIAKWKPRYADELIDRAA
jgi:hypothetical protein